MWALAAARKQHRQASCVCVRGSSLYWSSPNRLSLPDSRCASTLSFEEVLVKSDSGSDGMQPNLAIVVHGLLGTGRNWRTFARTLGKQAANESGRAWRLILVDQRNHGNSATGFKPPHTLQSAAQDLIDLVRHKLDGQQIAAVVGHSLGGKTTLELLKQLSKGGSGVDNPQQAWVLDANIGKVTLDKDAPSDVDKIIKEIRSLTPPIASREWLYKYMGDKGYSTGLQLWMGSNLVPDGQGKLRWGFDIDGAIGMYESYKVNSYWDVLAKPPKGTTLNIVRAAKSDRWTPQSLEQLEKARQAAANANDCQLRIHVLPDAGHWVHVDNPHGLLDMMLPSFISPEN